MFYKKKKKKKKKKSMTFLSVMLKSSKQDYHIYDKPSYKMNKKLIRTAHQANIVLFVEN